MELVLHFVVVAASVIGAGMAFPQARRLVVTGKTDGVSPMWIGVSMAINAWWIVYALGASVWVLLPVCTVSFALYAAMGVSFVRLSGSGSESLRTALSGMAVGAFGSGMVPLPALLLGGWAAAGVTIGFCYGLQLAPAVVAAFRSDRLDGISPGTWILSFVEGVLWLVYGAAVADAALLVGGLAGVAMAGAILVRLVATGHRLVPTGAVRQPAITG